MISYMEDTDFPEELVQPIKALTNQSRRKMLLSLLERDTLSYSQIRDDFRIKKGTLNHHLHILVSAGLVRNFSNKDPGNPYKSFYVITGFGRNLIEGLRQTLEQPKIIRKTVTFNGTATVHEEIVGSSTSEGEEAKSREASPLKIPIGS
jgi:DNA-binding HxlR family transcriptional regulator